MGVSTGPNYEPIEEKSPVGKEGGPICGSLLNPSQRAVPKEGGLVLESRVVPDAIALVIERGEILAGAVHS